MFRRELKIQPDDYLTLVLLGLTNVSLRDYALLKRCFFTPPVYGRMEPRRIYTWRSLHVDQRIKEGVSALQKYIALVHNPEEFHRDLGRGYFLLDRVYSVSVVWRKRKGPRSLSATPRS